MRLAAMEEILTPSFHGEKCRHNGENADYDIACDECDYFFDLLPRMGGGIRKDGRKVFWHVRNNASGAHFSIEEKFSKKG